MIQDIAPKEFHNEYRPSLPKADSRVMVFEKKRILCRIADGRLSYPVYEEVEKEISKECGQAPVYLFSVEERSYFLYQGGEKIELEGFGYEKMFRLRGMLPKDERFAGVTAYHLWRWYEENRYCGSCGRELLPDTKMRRIYCGECGREIFPRIDPAVIVAVYHGDELLLTKYAGREYKEYALIAGFTEIGETIEETVRREVMEETGIRVKRLNYYKSQPWGFSGGLLMGFFAEAEGDLTIHREEEELSEALWVKREDLCPGREGISLTEEMMRVFKEGKWK